MTLVWLAVVLAATPQQAPDTVVVCPVVFREALNPWVEHRQAQGHRLAIIEPAHSPERLRWEVRRIAKGGQVRFLVLVGDAEPHMGAKPGFQKRYVPVYRAAAKVNIRWGSEAHIAADNWYADLDDDELPEMAVGRLTADSPEDLQVIVKKILDYERSTDFGSWRSRLNFVAGVGGFGVIADTLLETAAKRFITDGIPAQYSTTMTYGNWRSPYCPDPRAFREATMERLNEGSLFWIYLGHGLPRELDAVRVPGGMHPILSADDAARLRCVNGAPIACFLACYTTAFDARQDCLAEDLLRAPGGPVAVLGGSRVTMPYAMSVFGTELFDEVFYKRQKTLGEAILEAKRNTMLKERGGRRLLLDAIAAAISPSPVDLTAERMEHLQLFNLVGDPLLRLRYPQQIKIDVIGAPLPGKILQVSGDCKVDGPCTVELAVRRDRLRFSPPLRREYDALDAAENYNSIYIQANDPRLVAAHTEAHNGMFSAQLTIPPEAEGPCHVRVFVRGSSDFAMGATDIIIKAPASSPGESPVE